MVIQIKVPRGKKLVEIEASVPKDYTIAFWYEKSLSGMPESEQEHVKEMLEQGFTSGELLYDAKGDGAINRGWWEVIKPEYEFC